MHSVFYTDEFPQRLDRYLRRIYPLIPQSFIEKSLRTKKIIINGNASASSYRLQKGDMIDLFINCQPFLKEEILPLALSQKDRRFVQSMILFEDDEVCIINKPSGLASQGGTNIKKHIDGLFQAYGKHYRLVHRLDRETSGVMILAKSLMIAQYLLTQFQEQKINKQYLALVHGCPKKIQGIIDAPLKKDKATMQITQEGDKAITEYKVVQSFESISVVEFQPKTGRTHQIRAHAAHVGHPIVGDAKYGSLEKSPLLLHAYSISFYNLNQNILTFKAPLSHHIEKAWIKLNKGRLMNAAYIAQY